MCVFTVFPRKTTLPIFISALLQCGVYSKAALLVLTCNHVPNIYIYQFAYTNVRFISCDGHQLYDVKERGVDLEVEGLRYIEMHRGAHTYILSLSPSRGGDLELEGEVNVSL